MKKKDLEKKTKEAAKSIKNDLIKELGLKEFKSEIQDSIKDLKKEFKAENRESVLKVFISDDVQKSVDELTKEEKTDAYARALVTGDKSAVKALSEGTPADGGYLVPQDFYNRLVTEMGERTEMRSKVTVIPMKTNVLTIPKHDTGPEVYWGVAENETKTTTTMDFTQPTITAYKLVSIIYMSDELLADAAFSLTDIIVKKFAEKMAEAEEAAIIAGSGVARPTGIFVNAVVVAAAIACVGNLDFDDIIDLIYALPFKYRKNAEFIIHNNNVRELRKLKDSDGRYLWQEPVAAGQPATIQGYPVYLTYECGEDEIAFGDYKEAYWLGDRQQMTVKITNDTETTFTKDQTAIRVVKRIGGDVIVTDAVRILNTIP